MRRVGLAAVGLVTVLASCASSGGGESAPSTTAAAGTPAPNTFTSMAAYFIGNSLSQDTLGGSPMGYLGIDMLARQAGFTFEPDGYHINCGQSLATIAEYPTETCEVSTDTGPLAEALPSDLWDVVTAQPYPGGNSTLLSDETVIADIAASIRSDASLFVLTGWPGHSNYRDVWDSSVADTDATPTTHSRAYFDLLMQRLDTKGVESQLIPTGEVLYRLDGYLREGRIEGMASVSDLYRDQIHLNNIGQWVASVTAASVILGADPDTFHKPIAPWFGEDSAFPPGFVPLVQQTVDEVLRDRP